jgi:hypothetical protein
MKKMKNWKQKTGNKNPANEIEEGRDSVCRLRIPGLRFPVPQRLSSPAQLLTQRFLPRPRIFFAWERVGVRELSQGASAPPPARLYPHPALSFGNTSLAPCRPSPWPSPVSEVARARGHYFHRLRKSAARGYSNAERTRGRGSGRLQRQDARAARRCSQFVAQRPPLAGGRLSVRWA